MGFLKSVGKLATGLVSGLNPSAWSGSSQQQDANAMAMTAWNLANDYNSPKAQVERLLEAGLNPYLVNLSGNTAGVPGLTGGNIQTSGQSAFSGLTNIVGALQGKANLSNTYAQTQASQAAAGASAAQANYTTAQTTGQEERNKWIEKTAIADLDYKKAQTNLANQQAKKASAEADIAQGEANIFGAVGGSQGAKAIGSGASTILRIGRSFFGGK